MSNSVNSPYSNFIQVPLNKYFNMPEQNDTSNVPAAAALEQLAQPQERISHSWFNKTLFLWILGLSGAFLLFKGGKNSLGQRLQKYKESFDKRLINLESQGTLSAPMQLYKNINMKITKGMKFLTEKLEWATNFIPFRDTYCEKACNKIGLSCIPNWFRNKFEGFTQWAHIKNFRSTASDVSANVDNLIALMEKARKNTTDPQQLRKLKEWQETLIGDKFLGKFHKEFGTAAFENRLNGYKDNIKSLFADVEADLKNIRSQKGYITDNRTAPYRTPLQGQLENFKSRLTGDLDNVKNVLTGDERTQAGKYVDKINKSLNTLVDSEMRVYQKFGEIKVGSAMTSVVDHLLTVGFAAWLITRAKDLDGYIEAGLEQGIPILAGLGTLIYCTTRMMRNVYAIPAGLVVGLVAKKLGDIASEEFRNHIVNRNLTNQAIAAYRTNRRYQQKS